MKPQQVIAGPRLHWLRTLIVRQLQTWIIPFKQIDNGVSWWYWDCLVVQGRGEVLTCSRDKQHFLEEPFHAQYLSPSQQKKKKRSAHPSRSILWVLSQPTMVTVSIEPHWSLCYRASNCKRVVCADCLQASSTPICLVVTRGGAQGCE